MILILHITMLASCLIGFTGFDHNAPAFKMAFSTTIAPNPPTATIDGMDAAANIISASMALAAWAC